MFHPWRTLYVCPMLVFLASCASQIPESIRTAPSGSPALSEIRAEPETFVDNRVRLGGTIASVTNLPDNTRLEIVSRSLQDNGRPVDSDQSDGRFIAQAEQFLDPAIYESGREVTVTGTLTGQEIGKIGEHHYTYPVVAADTVYLWEPLPERVYNYDPFLYSPYYDPWYPFWHPYSYWW